MQKAHSGIANSNTRNEILRMIQSLAEGSYSVTAPVLENVDSQDEMVVALNDLAKRLLEKEQANNLSTRQLREKADRVEDSRKAARDMIYDAEYARQQLAQQQHLLSTLADNVPDAIYFKDRKCRFIRVNNGVKKIFGVKDDSEILGKTDADFFTSEEADEYSSDERLIMKTGQPLINKEEYEVWRDGLTHVVLTTKMPLRDASGEIVGTFGISRDITQMKQLEARLQESEQQFRQFAEQLDGVTWIVSLPDFQFEYVSPNYETWFERDRKELEQSPMAWLQIVFDKDRDRVAQAFLKQADGERYSEEFRVCLADRSIRWVWAHGTVIEDMYGEPCRALGVVNDITNRKQAEAALADVASKLALPPRDVPQSDSKTRIDQFSLKDMMTFGAEIRGLVHDVIQDENLEVSKGPLNHARCAKALASRLVTYLYDHMVDENGDPALALVRLFETRSYNELGGQRQEIAKKIAPDIEPSIKCLALMATVGQLEEWCDVSRSSGHQAIPLPSEQAVERLPMIMQLIQQLGFELGGILNPDSEIMLGVASKGVFHVADAKGSPYIPAQENFVEPYGIKSVVGFGDVLPDGNLFAVIMFSKVAISNDVATLLSHLSHSAKLALLSQLDVDNKIESQIISFDRLLVNHEAIVAEQESHLRATLAELRRSNAELDSFAHITSHDLRSPLRNIQNIAKWIEQDAGDALPQACRGHLAMLEERIEAMNRLLNDLLQYSRVGRMESAPELLLPTEVVEEVLQLLHPPATVHVCVQKEMPEIIAPKTALRRVFQNLIENAIKHRHREEGQIQVSARRLGQVVEFYVSDDGPGIAPRFHEKVFQVYQSLAPPESGATGMGLSIVKKTVETYSGKIELESNEGEGAAFRFTWPQ